MQAEKIFHLGAGDQHSNTISKTDHNWTRNELHSCAHAGCAQNDEDHARHNGTHEQAIDAVDSDNSRNHDNERARGSADLRLRSPQRGDQKTGHYRTVDAGLRRHSGCNRECHREGQGYQADSHSGDDVVQKLVQVVFPQTQNGLGQPAIVPGQRKRNSARHRGLIMTGASAYVE